MKNEARFLGVRFATPQVTLGRLSRRAPAPTGPATVLLEWEVRVATTPRASWQVYYRFVTAQGVEEMGLAHGYCCYDSPDGETVRLLLPCPATQYEYRVVWDKAEDGTFGTPWQALPGCAAAPD